MFNGDIYKAGSICSMVTSVKLVVNSKCSIEISIKRVFNSICSMVESIKLALTIVEWDVYKAGIYC